MTHITVKETSLKALQPMRTTHLAEVTAPLDGMWESFVDMGQHYLLAHDGNPNGYCVLNEQRQIIQFHISDGTQADTTFKACIHELEAVGAVAATCDPLFFALALDHQCSLRVNALMYQHDAAQAVAPAVFGAGQSFELATSEIIDQAIAFGEAAIGAPKDWLTQYYGERIERGELWLLWKNSEILAAGECRISPHQKGIADVGMVVAEAERGKGLATMVLRALVKHALATECHPICSTEADNIGAQKAIERAGFTSRNRIVEFDFK